MQPERICQASRDHAQRKGANRAEISRQVLAVRHPRQLQAPADRKQRSGRVLAQPDSYDVLLQAAAHRSVPAVLPCRHGPAVDASTVPTPPVAAEAAVDRVVEKDRHGAAHLAHADALLHQTLHLLPVRVDRGQREFTSA